MGDNMSNQKYVAILCKSSENDESIVLVSSDELLDVIQNPGSYRYSPSNGIMYGDEEINKCFNLDKIKNFVLIDSNSLPGKSSGWPNVVPSWAKVSTKINNPQYIKLDSSAPYVEIVAMNPIEVDIKSMESVKKAAKQVVDSIAALEDTCSEICYKYDPYDNIDPNELRRILFDDIVLVSNPRFVPMQIISEDGSFWWQIYDAKNREFNHLGGTEHYPTKEKCQAALDYSQAHGLMATVDKDIFTWVPKQSEEVDEPGHDL